jgi:hypothetical protein
MNTAEQREREHEQAHPEQYHRGFHLIAWTCLQTGETGFDVYELGHGSLCEHPTREAAVAWIDDQFAQAKRLVDALR